MGSRRDKLRTVAYLRELAILGDTIKRAADRLGLHESWAHKLNRDFGIGLLPGTWGRPKWHLDVYMAVKDGYEAGLSPAEIAKAIGSASANSVAVMACRWGFSKRRGSSDPWKHRRRIKIPEPMRDQYRELRQLGLTLKEAARELKLPRQEALF